ncbi:pre-toxin TG domain-containing protein [Mesobacillus foraminis]|uniref:Putative toxin of predicted polymorphic toxin system n=1 Tax=Mesobacillus foraminis TaxID=279826 RepID=A0A4V2RDW1_9BACI|nr:pre-toxin TG domain-containing protein [Mesobacillus foraminis]TCN26340.1 putative toxin of predicted polymorphic toxin system [Mesobacillus foraminis]
MSRIQINADQLEAFADQIGRAEQECDHALNAINWHLGSLAANFPGTMPASIENLEADFNYQIKKYKHKLDDVQRLVKLTASSTRQSEQSLAGKVGGFLLEMVGWYDIQRLAGEYDPVTGEKLSAGDKALAGLMLALTIFPPAKAVGVGGKAVSMGVKAGKGAAAKTGFAAIAKTPEVFKGIRNVVSTQKVQKAFKDVYNDVVVAPFSATRQWIANTAKAMGDVRIPSLGKATATAGGPSFNDITVREAFSEAKENIVKMAAETEERWKGFVDKGIDNASVTNKSNLYRGDSLLHSPTRPNGIGKPHISSSGNLVPASKDGLYKGRQVTVTEHILGGYRKGAKSNSPYTSFTNNKNVIGNYGENAIELDLSALRKDIQSGKVKDVVILSPKQIQKLIERDVVSSHFWKNRAINWTKRDNEYLIKGEVPSHYIKVSPKE